VQGGVGFVDEQGGNGFGDDAKESRGADVGSEDGAVAEEAQDRKEGAFAAAFFGRLNAYIGGDIAEFKGVGMNDPESQGVGGVRREDDVAGEENGKRVQYMKNVRSGLGILNHG
jgi:hypothetical protein